MTVKAKLNGGFLAVAAIAALIGGVGLRALSMTWAHFDEVAEVRLPSIVGLAQMDEGQTAVKAGIRTLLIGDLSDDLARSEREQIGKAFERLAAGRTLYEPLPQTEEEAAVWKEFLPHWDAWKTTAEEVVAGIDDVRRTKNAAALQRLRAEKLPALARNFDESKVLLERLLEINEKIAFETNEDVDRELPIIQRTLVGVAVFGVLLAVALGAWLTRRITSVLGEIQRAAAVIAGGDLTETVNVHSRDEFGMLAASLNAMVTRIAAVIGKVRSSAEQLASASEEITVSAQTVSSGAQSISQGAQNQSSSVEQINASVEELAASVTDIAKNAGGANEIAEQTTREATDGGRSVTAAVDGMKAIRRSSEQIAEIIGVISEIADQTNLLALNAAIEAARAGEHGMGFAVVADEVRKLAERAAQAAKEITGLIKESTQRVADGSKRSEEAGEALKRIVAGIERTAAAIGQISAATEEQTATADEVAKGVQSIAAVTEESASAAEEMASSSEETAAGAEELAAQAQALRQLVEHFKVSGEMRWAASDAPADRTSGGDPALIRWDPERMSTGSATIDEQHRTLIQAIRDLDAVGDGPDGARGAKRLIEFLKSYVVLHFGDEERMMRERRCPAEAENKAAHAAFLRTFGQIYSRYQREGATPALIREIRTVGSDWLRNHILRIDVQLRGSDGIG